MKALTKKIYPQGAEVDTFQYPLELNFYFSMTDIIFIRVNTILRPLDQRRIWLT
jgi:hypothetical protein